MIKMEAVDKESRCKWLSTGQVVKHRDIQSSQCLFDLGPTGKSFSVTIQMKATRQYFPVVLCMVHNLILTFKPLDEIPKCDHSNES